MDSEVNCPGKSLTPSQRDFFVAADPSLGVPSRTCSRGTRDSTRWPMSRRLVFPGCLSYENQRYSYISGNHGMNQLSLGLSTVRINDFSKTPLEGKQTREDFAWMLTVGDGHLQICLAPSPDKPLRLYPQLDILPNCGCSTLRYAFRQIESTQLWQK